MFRLAVILNLAALVISIGFSNPVQAQAFKLGDIFNKGKEILQQGNQKEDQPITRDGTPDDEVRQDDTLEAGVEAAGACAGVSALTGGDEKNMLMTGAICGAAAALYTDTANKNRRDYHGDYHRLQEEISQFSQELDVINAQANMNVQDAVQLNRRVDDLLAADVENQAFLKDAQSIRVQLLTDLQKVEQENIMLKAKKEYWDSEVAALDAVIAEQPDDEQLITLRTSMAQERDRLQGLILESNSAVEANSIAKAKLDDAIIERS